LHDFDDQNDSKTRIQILDYIKKNPGVHFRKIGRELGLAMGQIQHHLSVLEETGKIKSSKINFRRHYYPAEILDEEHKIILAFLTNETILDILLFLIEHPDSTQTEITDFKGFATPTINWYMSRLIEAKIVTARREGKTVRYSIKGDAKNLGILLKTYHPNLWNKITSRFDDLFFDLSGTEGEETS
jgi:predicted transcriptional regulator